MWGLKLSVLHYSDESEKIIHNTSEKYIDIAVV